MMIEKYISEIVRGLADHIARTPPNVSASGRSLLPTPATVGVILGGD